jgi:hypothetical protein
MNCILNLDSPTSSTCSSGNCHWPLFESLGVCSLCSNVTATPNETCIQGPEDGGDVACNCTTPSGLLLQLVTRESSSGEHGTVFNATTLNPSKNGDNGITVALLARFSAVNLTESISGFDATECTLFWCAKTYTNVSMTSGSLTAAPALSYTFIPVNATQDPDAYTHLELVVPTNESNYMGNRSFVINYSDQVTIAGYPADLFTTYRLCEEQSRVVRALESPCTHTAI